MPRIRRLPGSAAMPESGLREMTSIPQTGKEGGATYRVHLADGRSFPCRSDETVLRAALSSGIDMPYECASGACGSCKCRVTEGRAEMAWPEAPGLSERDRSKGDRILACQARPISDLILNVRAGENPHEPAPHLHRGIVFGKERLCDSVARVAFRLAGPAEFLPGQFYIIDLPGAGRRAYSLANLANEAGWSNSSSSASPAEPAAPICSTGSKSATA